VRSGSGGLRLEGVTVHRAGVPVVRDVGFAAPRGEVTVLLGPNGAGKTTLLEAVSGVLPVASGTVWLEDVDVTALLPEERVGHGLAHVEQGRTVFAELTVEENLRVATAGPVEEVYHLFPELERRRRLPAGRLSGGEQQMLVIGRALLMEPTMLMVDEISLGLAPVVVRRLVPVVRVLARRGVGVLMVEQFATIALRVADRAVVLDRGEVVYEGEPAGLERRVDLLHGAYLGRHGGAASSREGTP